MPQGADRSKQINTSKGALREITWYKTSQNNCFLAPENQTLGSHLGPGSAPSSTNALGEAPGLRVPIFSLRKQNDSPKVARMGLTVRSEADLLEAGGPHAPSGPVSLRNAEPGDPEPHDRSLPSTETPHPDASLGREKLSAPPLGFSRPRDWLRGPEAGPERRANVMASDAARRFLLSVPQEPQLLLQAVGSPRRERRHQLLFPVGESGREGKRGGGGPAASGPLATSGVLETWGGNLGPWQSRPAPPSASGHPVGLSPPSAPGPLTTGLA